MKNTKNHEDMVPLPVAITNQGDINWFVAMTNNEDGLPAKKSNLGHVLLPVLTI